MTDLDGISDFLKSITAVIVTLTALLAAILALSDKLEPFWNKVLKPVLKFVIISLTLIIPNGAIIWLFILWIAEDLAPIINDPQVFLFVVFWSTAAISIYSLFWGMWLYPTIIRPRFKNQEQSSQQPSLEDDKNSQQSNNQGGEL